MVAATLRCCHGDDLELRRDISMIEADQVVAVIELGR